MAKSGESSNKRARSPKISSEVDQHRNLRDKSHSLSKTGRPGGHVPLVKTTESRADGGKLEKSNDNVSAKDV